MLKIGDLAPDFEALDDEGRLFRLSRDGGLRGTVLSFYPADFTPICTREMCRLDRVRERLLQSGWVLVGISPDRQVQHELFKRRHGLSLRLLCDDERQLFRRYGCLMPVIGWPLRVSWVVDPKLRIRDRVHAEFRIRRHEKLVDKLVGRPQA